MPETVPGSVLPDQEDNSQVDVDTEAARPLIEQGERERLPGSERQLIAKQFEKFGIHLNEQNFEEREGKVRINLNASAMTQDYPWVSSMIREIQRSLAEYDIPVEMYFTYPDGRRYYFPVETYRYERQQPPEG